MFRLAQRPIPKKIALALGNPGAPGSILDFFSFYAPLQNSIVLTKGVGSPTFTRASVATVVDFEGFFKNVKAGEARFTGARRIENLCPTSSASIAIAGNKTITVRVGTFVFSMGAEATASSVITFTGTATGSTGNFTANATKRTSKTLTITVAGTIIATCTVAAANNIQFENVTGQSNQNPGPYVSVGVLASPYNQQLQANGVTFDSSATGVDGVAYSKYQNGNTVASNIVTEAVGAPIADSTLKGYLSEMSRQNDALYSNYFTFGAVWGLSNVVFGSITELAPDGSASAWRFDSTNAAHYCQQPCTQAAGATTFSIFIKAGSAAFWLIRFYDGVYHSAWFDSSTGANSSVTAGITASSVSCANGFYRVSCTYTTGAINPIVEIRAVTADAGTTSPVGNGTMIIYGAQLELGFFASSYIPTITAAVARAADVLTYPISGNILGTFGSLYCEWQTIKGAIGYDAALMGDNTNTVFDRNSAGNNLIALYDGGFRSFSLTATTPTTVMNKIAFKWGGSSCNAALNGTLGTQNNSFDGDLSLNGASIGVGSITSGANSHFGNIRNVRIAQQPLNDVNLVILTR